MPDLTPEERDRIYQEEKARIEAQEQIRADMALQAHHRHAAAQRAKAQADSVGKWSTFIILGIVALIVGGLMAHGCGSSNSTTSTTPPPASVAVGDIGYITTGGGNVIVAATEDDLDDLIHEESAKDEDGISKMIVSGHAFFVKGGTAARMIGYGHGLTGFAVYHVRVTDGEHATDDGWIPMEFLKK